MSTVGKGARARRRSRPLGPTHTGPGRSVAGVALLFLLPALIALLLLRIAPAAVALVDSLSRTTLLGGTSFVGLGNYIELFTNPDFQNALAVTLLFSLIINPLQVAAALLLAVLFTRRAVGSRFWRSMVILPIAVPPAVSAVVWSVIYRPDGLANGFLAVIGIPPQPFLTSPYQSLLSVMILLSWIGVGYWMMFLIAGLNDIPSSYYEAASLDGASSWRQLWSITLPLLRRPLAFVLVADTVSNFLVFAPVQILTKGGPNGSTNLLMYDLYTRAYTFGDINKAQAEVVILVLITVVIVAAQFRLLKTEDQP
ncbi:sugar ABC transporter permease [Microbacterium sp.]|uniref:carbohydrate ABC transporter permease n=1 Tax=Microbacterium sp. TaxID=51671 RepID=UPI0028113F3D|nr:sugar ABC transporter permease [Microbacterium sp.]